MPDGEGEPSSGEFGLEDRLLDLGVAMVAMEAMYGPLPMGKTKNKLKSPASGLLANHGGEPGSCRRGGRPLLRCSLIHRTWQGTAATRCGQMDKSVQSCSGAIETLRDAIQIPGISVLVAPPDSPCQEIGKLHEPGCLGGDEHWNLGEIP